MHHRFAAVCATSAMFGVVAAAQRGNLTIPRVTTVYVSAVERSNVPVTDLTAKDFVLKEGGNIREIVKVEPAAAPMQVAIIIDDSGTGIFRYGVANFIDQLLGHAQFSIKRVVGQVQTLVDYTADVDRLRQAVLSLNVRAETPKGGQVVEGIFETSKELQAREAERPVIVVLTDTEAEYSSVPARRVLEQLQQSGGLLYVIAVTRIAGREPLQGGPSTAPGRTTVVPGAPSTVDRPSDLLERQIDVNQVLGDGPKQTGGRRAEIVGSAGPIPALQEIAEELNHQYLITYIIPAGAKPDQKISVSSKRRGVTVRAPYHGGKGTL